MAVAHETRRDRSTDKPACASHKNFHGAAPLKGVDEGQYGPFRLSQKQC
jgi:hypothetical protein